MPAHLFTRRCAVHDPLLRTPPGTTVVQCYRSALGPAEGAVVLVYTADDDPGPASYVTARLGCTYRDAEGHQRTARLSESDAAYLANTHAADCRAISRGIPACPRRLPGRGDCAPAGHRQRLLRRPARLPRQAR
jgi:hypothetical protein